MPLSFRVAALDAKTTLRSMEANAEECTTTAHAVNKYTRAVLTGYVSSLSGDSSTAWTIIFIVIWRTNIITHVLAGVLGINVFRSAYLEPRCLLGKYILAISRHRPRIPNEQKK